MNLQQRILAVFEPHEALRWGEVQERIGPDVERTALDVGLNALVRARKLTLTGLRYSYPKLGESEQEATAQPTSPHTAEHAIASSRDSEVTRICADCQIPQPICEFRLCGTSNKRAKTCNRCHAKRTKAGRVAANERRAAKCLAADMVKSAVPQASSLSEALSEVLRRPAEPTTTHTITVSNSVLERAQAKRQAALNRIQLLEVELANLQAEVERCERFVELYQHFTQGSEA